MKTWSYWVLGTALSSGAVAGCDKAPPAATPTGQAVTVGSPEGVAPTPAPAADDPHAGMAGAQVHGAPVPGTITEGQALPPGHPPIAGYGQAAPTGQPAGGMLRPSGPMGGPMGGTKGMGDLAAEAGVELPLVLEGAGSIGELKGRLAKVDDVSLHAALEEGFRKVFTLDRPKRDAARATELLEPIASNADHKAAALAERILGYVRINSGFDSEGAKARYIKAVELDADYGEAHYALAFTYAISDLVKGKEHFEKAMALGVPDTRQLRAQFYSN